MQSRILVFIPVFNCEKQISRVLNKIDNNVQEWCHEVLIIDNRSQDDTVNVAMSMKDNFKIKFTVLRNFENYNLGGSIKRAFLYAIENGYDYMISLHGDDQADVRDLLPILKDGVYKDNTIIVGARFHPKSVLQGYSSLRILGNKCLNWTCSLVTWRKAYDMIAGLNCFQVKFFSDMVFMNFPNDLTFDAHVLLYTFSKKQGVHYHPITWREEDQISNAKIFKQAFIILRLFVSYTFKREQVFLINKSNRPVGYKYESEVLLSK
jgi:glycosyltransferase involved in cell wall biosynthesis